MKADELDCDARPLRYVAASNVANAEQLQEMGVTYVHISIGLCILASISTSIDVEGRTLPEFTRTQLPMRCHLFDSQGRSIKYAGT